MTLSVEAANELQLEQIAMLHEEAFPGFFLTLLGRAFLRELYLGFMTDDRSCCLVAELDSGDIAGLVAGTTLPAGFFRRLLLRRGWRFCFAASAALVRHPRTVVPKLVKGAFYRGDAPSGKTEGALLSSIAVSPKQRGGGVGERLVESFEDWAARKGARMVYLTTDKFRNEGVLTFYRRMGYAVEGTLRKADGRVMSRLIKHLGEA